MGFLSPYRVLDLTNERGLLAGKMFADLGADVIQVEPIVGSSARQIGPFHEDVPEGERSLFWDAYACNKQGVVKHKRQEGEEALFALEIWSENSKGISVGPGTVVVALPRRHMQAAERT